MQVSGRDKESNPHNYGVSARRGAALWKLAANRIHRRDVL